MSCKNHNKICLPQNKGGRFFYACGFIRAASFFHKITRQIIVSPFTRIMTNTAYSCLSYLYCLWANSLGQAGSRNFVHSTRNLYSEPRSTALQPWPQGYTLQGISSHSSTGSHTWLPVERGEPKIMCCNFLKSAYSPYVAGVVV